MTILIQIALAIIGITLITCLAVLVPAVWYLMYKIIKETLND